MWSMNTGTRIVALRRALGFREAATFAAFIGISPQRLSQIEGKFPLSRTIAQLIVVRVPGVTLDWLYNGVRGGLSVSLDRDLQSELERIPPVRKANTGHSVG